MQIGVSELHFASAGSEKLNWKNRKILMNAFDAVASHRHHLLDLLIVTIDEIRRSRGSASRPRRIAVRKIEFDLSHSSIVRLYL